MRLFLTAAALVVLASAAPPARAADAAPPAAAAAGLPAGVYTLDKPHGSLIFRVDHLGFSHYTARFTRFDATLRLDPAQPAAARLEASVDPASLTADNPPPGFEAMLRGPDWLDVARYPAITFRSTMVEPTGPDTARVTGDFTLHGVTRPLLLEARFNGGYAGHPLDPHARIGFSAHGTLLRSEFGIAFGIPAPGTKMGVSDTVEVVVEAEFNGPAWAEAPTTP
jgi:polyisoprenoid-binding protein YceI